MRRWESIAIINFAKRWIRCVYVLLDRLRKISAHQTQCDSIERRCDWFGAFVIFSSISLTASLQISHQRSFHPSHNACSFQIRKMFCSSSQSLELWFFCSSGIRWGKKCAPIFNWRMHAILQLWNSCCIWGFLFQFNADHINRFSCRW